MSRHDGLYQWVATVATHLPHLSKAQATVLAFWSFGMVMVGSCGCTTVAAFLAKLLKQKDNTVRQRLREWYWEAAAKQGDHRQTLEVQSCFASLLHWILRWWDWQEQRLALALDATTLGQRFTVLVISVLYRSCAIPVAWVVVPATTPGAWKPHWLSLFALFKTSVPATWTVIVLADRGLYARWLYRQVQRIGWHPFFRINSGGKFRPTGQTRFRLLRTLAPGVGAQWFGQGTCFKSQPLASTLLVRWDAGHAEPWLILTDLAPQQAQVCWYTMRAWIECDFKDTKRGGWQWQQTQISDPARAERFWLALAVATLWVVSVGGAVDANLPASSLDPLPISDRVRCRTAGRSQPRQLSCFRQGRLEILAALLAGTQIPLGRFFPEPWPDSLLVKVRSKKTYP